ncbi:venom acid phosphatase Acph-1-like [Zophobas morio]|uniref:venom acid phosphatase Acph-1-like n=1 Tax=Zophobas morio TaxID=2755281 RepID=UPI00308375B1
MRYLLVFCVFAVSSLQAKEQTLQLVHVFFRHGSRTPEHKHVYPTDPYDAQTFWPMGYGALTNKGKQMSFKLGDILRQRYDSFLGDLYVPEMVEAVSTDFDRTKASLLLVLAALFPPAPAQRWSDSLPWMPIPIHFDKDRYDYTLRRPTHYCPAYVKELEEVLLSDDIQRQTKQYRDLFKYIEEHTKIKIDNTGDAFNVYQTLNAEANMNLTLPEWSKTVYPEPLQTLAGLQCNFENYNAILKTLNGGRMLGVILKHMIDKSNRALSPAERKIYLYSGHENNVVNILATLNLFKPHVPKYSAAVIVELHYLNEKMGYGVKVLYLRDVDSEPEEQKLEGCDAICPLSSFIRIVEPHIPVNYTKECHALVNLD